MTKRIPIQKILLTVVAASGVVAVSAIAPGIGPAFKLFGVRQRNYSETYVHNALFRMRQKGLIEFKERNGKRHVALTKKGKQKLETVRISGYKFKKPKRWDGKWRIVVFDIKENKRNIRDHLRRELQSIGFVRLQHSVWIFPYECEEFIKLLKADNRIGKDVLYITAENVEYDKNIKNLFDL